MPHRRLSLFIAPIGVLVMVAVFLSTGQAAPLQPKYGASPIPNQGPSGEAGILATGSISGVVTAENGGAPLSGIRVCTGGILYQCATTGDDGFYTIGGLDTDSGYTVEFQDDAGIYAYEYYDNKLDWITADQIAVTDGSTTPDINAALSVAGHITGTLTNSSGAPLPNIDVDAYEYYGGNWIQVRWSQSDAAGRYDLGGLQARVYRLGFVDWSGNYISECYAGAPDILSATDVSVGAGSTVGGINAVLAEHNAIINIRQLRFARPGQAITVEVKIRLDSGPSQLHFGLQLPNGWDLAADPTYGGEYSGTLVYDSDLAAELSAIDDNGTWWAGVGPTETWSGAPVAVTLSLHSAATTGDQWTAYAVSTVAPGMGRNWDIKGAPILLTAQQPVHGQAVASVRDASTIGFGSSTSLQRAQAMRAPVVYHYLGWDTVEVGQGEYKWAILDDILEQVGAYGEKVVLRIYNPPAWRMAHGAPAGSLPASNDDLRVFMSDLTAHVRAMKHQQRVAGYVIWNEPNIRSQWGGQAPDAAAYMAMLQAAYEGAKEGDPAAVVVSAPLAPTDDSSGVAINDLTYLGQLYGLGLVNYADVIGMNGLGFQHDPDYDTSGPDYNFMRLKYLHDVMVDKGDADRSVWALEVGWLRQSSYNMGDFEAFKVPALQQAHYLARAFQKAGDEWPWMQLMAVWNLDFDRYYPPTSTFRWYSVGDNALAQVLLSDTDPPTYDDTFDTSGDTWSPLPTFALTVPSGSLTNTTTFELITYPGQGQILPVGLGFTTVGFNFTLTAEDFNGPVTHFSPPLQLSLTIPDSVSDPSAVKLYTYREGVGWMDVCVEQGSSCQIVDRQLNVELTHLSDFVLVVPGGTSVYLPVILKKR